MDNKEELQEAHRQYMAKVEAYAEQKKKENSPEHEEFHKSKDEWKVAWNKMMEALLVLERLEI
ncbi:MAG: hypothetical protein ABI091_23560 [Ferruginibacter sp.]